MDSQDAEAAASLDALIDALIDRGRLASVEAERIVSTEWQRLNPGDPITDILRARDILLGRRGYQT